MLHPVYNEETGNMELVSSDVVLSRSDLETATRCRRKYYYKNILGLGERVSGGSASEGTIIHAGLAAAFAGQADFPASTNGTTLAKLDAVNAVKAMVDAGESEYRGEMFKLAPSALEELPKLLDVVCFYMDNQFLTDIDNARVVSVEENYQAEILPGVKLEGQIDLILERTHGDGTKVLEVYDHKTVDDVKKSLDFLRLDIQFLVYEWLVRKNFPGQKVEMVYNLIRRDRPPGYGSRELAINKDGSVSKKNASTDPADYLKQERIGHSDKEVAHIELTLQELADYTLNLKTSSWRPTTRTVIQTGGQACSNCEFFKSHCAPELLGHTAPTFETSSIEVQA